MKSLPAAVFLTGLLTWAGPLAAQSADTVGMRSWTTSLITIGSDAEERARTDQLLGATAPGQLIRSASSLNPSPAADGRLRWAVVEPEILTVWNSAIPNSVNDGSMWAGRGLTTRLLGGIAISKGRARLLVVPEVVRTENGEFELFYGDEPQRNRFSTPWFTGKHSADLPTRFGDRAFTSVFAGQSSATVDLGALEAGAATENQWWGPGVRNSIVMSNNAAGIPHLFVRTSRPVQTRIGAVEGRWMAGLLAESEYFDSVSANQHRSLNAMAVTLAPKGVAGLTLGIARSVYSAIEERTGLSAHLADVVVRWPGERSDSADARESEQLMAMFGRWVFPESGLEVYGEWARYEMPSSLRDFLVDPGHTQGYTAGFQWARPAFSGVLRVHSEATYLENDASFRVRPIGSYYASPSIPQGYTHRGQSIGAAIGPGASSQWIGVDHLAPQWRAGVFGGRTRWANDAYYDDSRINSHLGYYGHDVSMFAGARMGLELPWMSLIASLQSEKRYNFLFQNYGRRDWTDADSAIDVRNTQLRLQITPRLARRTIGTAPQPGPAPAFHAPGATSAEPDGTRPAIGELVAPPIGSAGAISPINARGRPGGAGGR